MAERERDGIVCTVSPCCAGYWLAFSVDVDVDGDGDGDVNVAVHVGGLLSLFLVVGCRLAGFWLLVAGGWCVVLSCCGTHTGCRLISLGGTSLLCSRPSPVSRLTS